MRLQNEVEQARLEEEMEIKSSMKIEEEKLEGKFKEKELGQKPFGSLIGRHLPREKREVGSQ